MTGGVASCVWVFVEVANLPFVDGDRQHFFLFELIGMILIALHNHEALVLMQANLRRHQENLRKEVLFFEYFLIVWLLELAALVHLENIIIAALTAAEHPPARI